MSGIEEKAEEVHLDTLMSEQDEDELVNTFTNPSKSMKYMILLVLNKGDIINIGFLI